MNLQSPHDRPTWLTLAVACVALAALSGCSDGASPEVRALRSKFLTKSEPTQPAAFSEVRQELDPTKPVVIVGRIGVPDQEPWVTGRAAFTVRDATDEKPGGHGGKNHDPATCPFCKRKASQPEAMAIVQFLDERGEVLGIDARELFDLAENQRVVVQGRASLADETLVVSAETLYITPE